MTPPRKSYSYLTWGSVAMGPARRSSMQSTWVVSRPPSPARYRKRTRRSPSPVCRTSGLTGEGTTFQPSGVRKENAPDGCLCSRGSGGGEGGNFLPAQAAPGKRKTARIAVADNRLNCLRKDTPSRASRQDVLGLPQGQEHGLEDAGGHRAALVGDPRGIDEGPAGVDVPDLRPGFHGDAVGHQPPQEAG